MVEVRILEGTSRRSGLLIPTITQFLRLLPFFDSVVEFRDALVGIDCITRLPIVGILVTTPTGIRHVFRASIKDLGADFPTSGVILLRINLVVGGLLPIYSIQLHLSRHTRRQRRTLPLST